MRFTFGSSVFRRLAEISRGCSQVKTAAALVTCAVVGASAVKIWYGCHSYNFHWKFRFKSPCSKPDFPVVHAEDQTDSLLAGGGGGLHHQSNSNAIQSWHYRRFCSFASVEHEHEYYMTPIDFLRCASGILSSIHGKRRFIDDSTVQVILKNTPDVSRSSPSFFTDLGDHGLISFTEYMFLLSLVTHPQSQLLLAFRMFDRDMSEEVDIGEYRKIANIISRYYVGDFSEGRKASGEVPIISNPIETTLQRHFFGKNGARRLKYADFLRFVTNLQSEVLFVEYNHFCVGKGVMFPFDLGCSLMRFIRSDCTAIRNNLSKLSATASLAGKTISFDSYKALFGFLYVLEDFSCALQMFTLAKHSITKDEFQQAARAVTGSLLDPVVLDTIFVLFDVNEDGCLSSAEFIETIRARGAYRSSGAVEGTTRLEAFKNCVGNQLTHSV